MHNIKLYSTRCTICDTEGNATELYSANFGLPAFNPAVFSARRLPDQIHYRMVKCRTCGLVRADPVIDVELLVQLYAQSDFDYTDELINLKFTYGRYLAKLANFGAKKDALFEIGCGNGFFLEEALTQGYAKVRGVEPSASAVARARADLRQYITCDIMRPGLFRAEQFDVICMFQIFDHISEPGILLDECFRLLKPRGLMLCLSHNIDALATRLLGSRSPIIDIEHTYLYSLSTLRRLFTKHGFQVKGGGSVSNRYTLYYLARLIPLPTLLKWIILAALKKNLLGRISVSIPLGNLYLIAQKPDSGLN